MYFNQDMSSLGTIHNPIGRVLRVPNFDQFWTKKPRSVPFGVHSYPIIYSSWCQTKYAGFAWLGNRLQKSDPVPEMLACGGRGCRRHLVALQLVRAEHLAVYIGEERLQVVSKLGKGEDRASA